MKLKGIYEEEMIGDENVMVSLDNKVLNGIIRTNETATFILSVLKNETSLEDVISKVSTKYNVDYLTSKTAVSKIISQLYEFNLIEE